MTASVPVVRFTVAGQGEDAASAGVGRGRPYVLVYDGSCKVCGRAVNVIRRWDTGHQIEIISSQTPGVAARFPWIPRRAYEEAMQLVGPGGHTWQGAESIEVLLDVIPRGYLIGWLFSFPFARPLANRLYRWFARNRYRLGCGDHCQYQPTDVSYEGDERSRGQSR